MNLCQKFGHTKAIGLSAVTMHHESTQGTGRPNFQYIITTTEPPPEHLKTSGHIILPLDASTKEGQLFMEDL